MSFNFKPITQVPEVFETAAGDKVLLNSSGVAKQIDVSKIGGSGGTVYVDGTFPPEDTSNQIAALAFADAEYSKKLNYETAKKLLIGGAAIHARTSEAYGVNNEASASPIAVIYMNDARAIQCVLHIGEMVLQMMLICSDTILD